jgi:segregation and condensation protein B
MQQVSTDLASQVSDLIAVLLVAGEGAERRAVQRALEVTPAQLTKIVAAARQAEIPGLMVQEHEGMLRLVTRPESGAAVRRFVQAPHAIRLSGAALETLAVIAYGQPTTRSQVQDARGVNSDGPITTLLQHGLIAEAGRAEGPGRPILFETTAECLTLLGLAGLDELPALQAESGAPHLTVVSRDEQQSERDA